MCLWGFMCECVSVFDSVCECVYNSVTECVRVLSLFVIMSVSVCERV